MSTVVRPDGTTLAVETLGSDDDPVLLLIAGAGWSRDWWDDELCDRLVGAGLRVVRYDHRDTGESTHWPVGAPGYTGADLLADAVAVLDALGADRAHLVGLSLGGAIAQEIALATPQRVASLTLIATTAVDPRVGALPGVTPELSALFAQEAPEPDRSDPVAAAEALVAGERPFAGPDAFDEARVRAIARRVVARSRDLAASANHFLLAGDRTAGPDDLSALAGLPVLVVHGAVDPLFPVEHGRALAAMIPGARLLEIEGMGHQLPPASSWDGVVDAITAQTRVASTPQ
ncbi:alpha/beta hydrolase [Actinomycetospora sp.]|uniref:alpha/beta fold hydrolase n=1 Tax=Actinomycetospora sp. TaxID=1872135 RepID=UPI002F3E43A2